MFSHVQLELMLMKLQSLVYLARMVVQTVQVELYVKNAILILLKQTTCAFRTIHATQVARHALPLPHIAFLAKVETI